MPNEKNVGIKNSPKIFSTSRTKPKGVGNQIKKSFHRQLKKMADEPEAGGLGSRNLHKKWPFKRCWEMQKIE